VDKKVKYRNKIVKIKNQKKRRMPRQKGKGGKNRKKAKNQAET